MTSRALKNQMVAIRSSRDRNEKILASVEIVVRCKCGRGFTADEWAKLAPNGVQHIEEDGLDAAEVLELRTCICGSTIAKPWEPPR